MEENIKILEDLEKRIRNDMFFEYSPDVYSNAIENLIKGYKELEKVCKAQANKINNYEEWIKVGMIPKSKIEEEFEKMTAHNNCFNLGDIQLLLDNILEEGTNETKM